MGKRGCIQNQKHKCKFTAPVQERGKDVPEMGPAFTHLYWKDIQLMEANIRGLTSKGMLRGVTIIFQKIRCNPRQGNEK